MKGYIPLFLLPNGFIACGPSVHSEVACAETAQPILKPFAVVPVEIPETNSDTPRTEFDDWNAAARAQVNSQIAGFLQFHALPRAEREARAATEASELEKLRALVNSPHTNDFLHSVRMEVAHQVERWGTVHDRAKEPADWFWLLAYLSGKALAAHIAGDVEKAKHHTISSAAMLANWHAAIACADNRMQPGSGDLQQFLKERFGDALPEAAAEG